MENFIFFELKILPPQKLEFLLIKGVTCSISDLSLASLYDFSNVSKVKTSTSCPSGKVSSKIFET